MDLLGRPHLQLPVDELVVPAVVLGVVPVGLVVLGVVPVGLVVVVVLNSEDSAAM